MATPTAAQVPNRAGPRFFQVDGAAVRAAAASPLAPQLRQYRAYSLDLAGLRAALVAAPMRGNASAAPLTLALPMPDGTTQRFRVWEAPVMAPALAAKYPNLHTYGGQGIENKLAQLSLTVSPQTFSAQVLNGDEPRGTAYVQAAASTDALHYLSYFAQDVIESPLKKGGCGSGQLEPIFRAPLRRRGGPSGGNETSALVNPVGPTLTVYRLYVTTTQEYTDGRADATVQAEVVGVINFVRLIQERDLAITISLVGTKFYRAGDTGNYDQTSDFQMIKQNQLNVKGLVTAGSYDYAHLFAASGSGLAFTGVVGNNNPNGGGPYENPATSSTAVQVNGPLKAGAVSGNNGRTVPAPDYFATSVVAHEMGHQFSATHTANTGQGACTSNRTPGSAWEAGKGSTIMSYADVGCDSPISNVIVNRADPYYHTGSLEQIRTFIETIPAVGTAVASGNRAPAVGVPFNRTIPRNTPFKLTATGTDADADVLRYAWEELDLGPAADLTTTQVTNDNVPLFRSVLAGTAGATRFFPRLSFLGGSPTASTSNTERLPAVARTLTFRCTVRDYHAVAGAAAASTASSIVGGVALSSLVTLTVSAANATPFAVTAPNTAVTWAANSTQSVTWNGVGTKTSAVNCQTVNVRLSTDGGLTYPVVLAAGVPNVDGAGSVSVTMPNTATATARVMLEAADNYFFDISDADFAITAAPAGPAILSVGPPSGPAGTALTINGSGFGTSAGALAVTVGGVAATITGTVTATSFQVTVPATALTGSVVVTKTGAGAGTATGGVFQVTPVITALSISSGTVGTPVVISGNSFGGSTRVSFNGGETTTFTLNTAVSPNTITVSVPGGATSGRISVYTAGGSSSEDALFTVVPFTVVNLVPAPNASAVREFTSVVATFSAPVSASNSTTAPVKVSSLQAGGRKAGTTTVSGSSITFDPTTNFRAGEVVQVSVTPAAVSTASAALAQGYVGQYTARTRTASGITSTTSTVTGTRPEHLVAGKLNADANLDLVVVNRTAGTVSVFLKDATGPAYTQAAGSPITVSATPNNAALADFDNDGNLDLVVACGGSSLVNVFRGNGDGTFIQQASLAAIGSNWVTVGDLNGDGNLDLVATQFTNPGTVVVGLGDGTSSLGFATSTITGLGVGPRSVVLADFNEDGRLDMAVANFNGTGTGGISVRLGTGAGSFTGSTELVAAGANGVVAADLTGDGHADLATANTYGTGLSVFAGTGTGTFGSPTALVMSSGFTYTLSTGDYDGNGTIDLIAPRSASGAGGVEVFTYNSGTGTYAGPTIVASGGFGPGYVAVVDLNNDGALDFAAVNSSNANTLITSLATATGTPLPVELVSFAAQRTGPTAVQLSWRTASELRNVGFVVERSLNGTGFGPVSALLPGLGTSSTGQVYRHLDEPAPAALLYYRLRQVDVDGAVKYSPVATVAAGVGNAPAQLLVFPNPARLAAFVRLRGPVAPDEPVLVLDALGREVRRALAPPEGGTLEVSLRGVSAGLYVVRCGVLSQRLVVE